MKKIYFLVLVLGFYVGNAQIINFPDANFKAKLLSANETNGIATDYLGTTSIKIDLNNNGEIEISEANRVYRLNVSSAPAGQRGIITSLIGIKSFTNLSGLNCVFNMISSLDLSGITTLRSLFCTSNFLTDLNLTGLTNLVEIGCSGNMLTSLNTSDLRNLASMICSSNNLVNLDLSSSNLYADDFFYLECGNNPNLNIVNIKRGRQILNFSYLHFSNCPNLKYICIDEQYVTNFRSYLAAAILNFNNVEVNSYCFFNSGGTFYTILGNQKFDSNNNGCDAVDNSLPNLKYSISDGTNSSNLISNFSGDYYITMQAGTQTITPIFENPTYFNISPSNVVVTFPTQPSPVTQNFCVTANGVHPDLEVTLLQITPARPGFNAVYKLIYKNKGNTTQSGSVNVNFNDAVLDFLAAAPTVTAQIVDNLSWAFTNLLPFETREITFTFKVNSPTQTPAVTAGTVLNYVATITSPATDEMPNDNTFIYNQTVVNSFDPNDKTCSEGATISQAKVGDYVHYMIRFENNGTANAQNIVVKDIIDTAKFDINSIVPIKGSHSFVTNITAGNKVEFIFENIQLPFATGTNQGFVAFKIKTKATLVNGDSFSNKASIYFDYNFPIVTNTATTTIQTLKNQDFEFATYFSLYPNPVKDNLTIDFKDSIEVKSITIYNALGQLVLVIPNAQNLKTVDVSSLNSGNYFIKINSDKGSSAAQFIKQ